MFGTLVERLISATIKFAPDGELIGTASAAISATVKPASAAAYNPYDLGRVNKAQYVPETKASTREWGMPTGGYKQRNEKRTITDAFLFTLIDYAPYLYDQLMFGTANLADPADGAQQAFELSHRKVDGWAHITRYNEAGEAISTLEIHARLSIETYPEDMNEPGSPVMRIELLGDGGALDELTPALD